MAARDWRSARCVDAEGVRVDVVFPVRPGDDNEELRYSLRSVAAHLPHGRVWLAGHKPAWVSDEVGHIPTVQDGSKWANSRGNRLAACRHPGVSEEFVLFNDDMFVMQPVGRVPVWHRGPVTDVIAHYRGVPRRRQQYLTGMVETYRWLRTLGFDSPLSYELHAPLPVTKTGLAGAIELAEQAGLKTPHVRTIYGALAGIGGEQHEDVKIHDMSAVPPEGAVFVSTTDRSFERGRVGAWVRERLAWPGRYER